MRHFLSILIPVMMLSACARSAAPKDRTISFEGIENARELGGLVMQDGRAVRPGKLVRSGELSKASDSDVAILKNRFALTDIFDFRFEDFIIDLRIQHIRYKSCAYALDLMRSGSALGKHR